MVETSTGGEAAEERASPPPADVGATDRRAREHLLFALVGLLIGFLAGYFVQEEMAARQPRRLPPGAVTPSTSAAGAPGMQAMEQILQLRDYVEQNPEDRRAVLTLANLNFEVRQWARARELYTQYLELDPDNADVITDLGVCLREEGRFQEALERFRRAQELEPDHWQSRYNEVVVLAFDLRRPGAATTVLEELQRLQPENPSVQQLAEEVGRLGAAS